MDSRCNFANYGVIGKYRPVFVIRSGNGWAVDRDANLILGHARRLDPFQGGFADKICRHIKINQSIHTQLEGIVF